MQLHHFALTAAVLACPAAAQMAGVYSVNPA